MSVKDPEFAKEFWKSLSAEEIAYWLNKLLREYREQTSGAKKPYEGDTR